MTARRESARIESVVVEEIRRLVVARGEPSPASLPVNARLDEAAGIGSLEMVALVAALDRRLAARDASAPAPALREVRTVGDLVRAYERPSDARGDDGPPSVHPALAASARRAAARRARQR